jgi:hypothetical protein
MDQNEPNPFRCPLCATEYYTRVRVRRANGSLYTTEFFSCLGCTIMFRDPGRFMNRARYDGPPPDAVTPAEELVRRRARRRCSGDDQPV